MYYEFYLHKPILQQSNLPKKAGDSKKQNSKNGQKEFQCLTQHTKDDVLTAKLKNMIIEWTACSLWSGTITMSIKQE